MAARTDLESIYREHHTFVWRLVRRFGVASAGIDDVVQEVFVILHRRWGELDRSGSVRGLLYGITRKVASRARDRAQARAAAPLHAVPDATARGPDPQVAIEVEEKAQIVRAALDALDEDKRMAFVLVDIEGMSVVEAADCLGINLNTAYARIRAARQRIQKAIARHKAAERGDEVRAGSR